MSVAALLSFPLGGGTSPVAYAASTRYALDKTNRPRGIIAQSQYGYAGLHDSTAGASGKTWVAWLNAWGGASVRIAEYDHGSQSWSGPYVVGRDPLFEDDRTVPVLEQLADGRLVVFWGSHNDTDQTDQFWAISDSPQDASAWTEQAPLTDGEYTYPKPVDIPSTGGDGTLYLIYRRSDGGNGKYDLAYQSASYTADGAVSFGAASVLVEAGTTRRIYADKAERDASGDIEFVWTISQGTGKDRTGIYYARFDVSAGALVNLDGTTTVASGSLPLAEATADSDFRLVDVGSDRNSTPTWCRDSGGDLHIVWAQGTGTGTYNVYHQSWPASGGSPTTATVVAEGFEEDDTSGLVRTAQIVPVGSNVAVYWVDTSNFSRLLYRERSGGTWGSEQELATTAVATTWSEAAPVRRANADARVFLSEQPKRGDADYDEPEFHPLSVHGANGFLAWPTPDDADYKYVVLQVDFTGANGATTATDESQMGAELEFNNGAEIQGNALELGDSDEFVRVVADSEPSDNRDRRRFNFAGAFAWEFWDLNITGDNGNGADGRCWIFGNSGDSGERGSSIAYRIDTQEWHVDWADDNDSITKYIFDPSESPVGKTVYLAVTRDESDDLRLFMAVGSGTLVQQGSAQSMPEKNDASAGGVPDFSFGARAINSNPRYAMAGTIGAARISNGIDRGLAAGQTPPARSSIWNGKF